MNTSYLLRFRLSFSIILMTLFISSFSCRNQTKARISSASTTENEEKAGSEKVAPREYGAGDIVTNGYLDSSGTLWFTTTTEGVYQYDGETFLNISEEDGLCSNEVWAVIEDKEDMLWFATAKGLCRFDGNDFLSIPLPHENAQDVSPDTGFPSRSTQVALTLIQDSNGHFWVGTNSSGAYQYDGATFTPFLRYKGRIHPDDSVYNNCITSILEDQGGNIWFTSITHGGISRYDGESIIEFTTEDGLLGDMTTSSFEDQVGNIWFGSIQNLNGGVMRFDGESFESFTKEDGLCDSNVACFYEDESGIIWIGTGDGVCYYDGKTFTPFEYDGQSLGDIRFIMKDKGGNMWFGGRYGVLYKYDRVELKDVTHIMRND